MSLSVTERFRLTASMSSARQEFEKVFPRLVGDLKEHCKDYHLPEQALTWFEKVDRSLFALHFATVNRPTTS